MQMEGEGTKVHSRISASINIDSVILFGEVPEYLQIPFKTTKGDVWVCGLEKS